MNQKNQKGFTLIELMVTLVVAGFLLSGLVALSGSVQRSFGRSKEISTLQSNLRFSMMRLTDDLRRAGFMSVPEIDNETKDSCHLATNVGRNYPTGNTKAISYDDVTMTFNLMGNYVSSHMYRYDKMTREILCQDGQPFDPASGTCGLSNENEQNNPYKDGPTLDRVFVPNRWVRVWVGNSGSTYAQVQNYQNGIVDLVPPLPDVLQGDNNFYLSPLSQVSYQIVENQEYISPHPNGSVFSAKWDLIRTVLAPDGTVRTTVVAEFLLPPSNDGATPGGMDVLAYVDQQASNFNYGDYYTPDISPVPIKVSTTTDIDPHTVRALVVTIRARSETEDPEFVVNDMNYGVDLDGNPQNGMARVRVESTVVELRNLGVKICL